jgi:UDP-3-O-[3-hydroxymyristoyl] glucosamine N-acyltransferase
MKLSEIAKIIGAEYDGEEKEILSMNTLKDASSNELSFIANPKYVKDMATSKAAAILVDEKTKEYVPQGSVALVVDDAYWQMATLSKYFSAPFEDRDAPQAIVGEGSFIDEKAAVANGAVIGKNSTIMAGAYVGSGAKIGDNTIIYPNVVIYRDCEIGNNCIIHAGSVIGSDGFGFASNKRGEHNKIYHNGNAIIEDDVEIGANTTVDRAVFGSTIIKKGARIDNLVQIGHNCVFGEGSVAVAQSGFAGSTVIGRNNVFGGQSATAGHLEIAPFNRFAARSGITKSIKESGKTFAGFPLTSHKTWLKIQGKIARLIK